jgi:4-amino-4-deoxy-L-arabinose transferase-like glycosyltransferase
MAVSALIAIVIGGVWLAIVWNKPQFQHAVLGTELGNKLRGAAPQGRPVYYYVKELFGRTEPWPLVALAALWFARGKDEWRRARFCAIWWLVVVLLFTLMPDKRADRLLPAYPPMFMLAGLGIRNFLALPSRRVSQVILGVFSVILILLPSALLVHRLHTSAAAFWLIGILALSGLLAIVSAGVNAIRAAVLLLMTGLIASIALYDHGFGNDSDTNAYADIVAFARAVEDATPPEKVLVWKSDLLVSYELGLHQRGVNPAALTPDAFDWVVTTNDGAQEITAATGWKLEPADPTLPATKNRPETRLYKRL